MKLLKICKTTKAVSLIEVLISLAIISLVALSSTGLVNFSYRVENNLIKTAHYLRQLYVFNKLLKRDLEFLYLDDKRRVFIKGRKDSIVVFTRSAIPSKQNSVFVYVKYYLKEVNSKDQSVKTYNLIRLKSKTNNFTNTDNIINKAIVLKNLKFFSFSYYKRETKNLVSSFDSKQLNKVIVPAFVIVKFKVMGRLYTFKYFINSEHFYKSAKKQGFKKHVF